MHKLYFRNIHLVYFEGLISARYILRYIFVTLQLTK